MFDFFYSSVIATNPNGYYVSSPRYARTILHGQAANQMLQTDICILLEKSDVPIYILQLQKQALTKKSEATLKIDPISV